MSIPGSNFAWTAPGRLRFLIFIVFLCLCFLGGGGSREDIFSLLYLRPAAAFCLAALLALPGRIDLAVIRTPLYLLAGLAFWIALQLVPLPPAIWTALPGREHLVAGASVLGVPPAWRPLSLSPDLTLNSLAATIIPFTALIGFATLGPDQRRRLLPWLLGGAVVSMLFIIAQLAGGPDSPFYLYRVTNEGAAVGLFANRNHEAFLLVMALPMLALWASQHRRTGLRTPLALGLASAIAILFVLMLLVIGSRAGLVLGVMAAVWSIYQFRQFLAGPHAKGAGHWKALAIAVGATAIVGSLAAFIAFTRAEALQRLLNVQLEQESRVEFLPILLRMVGDYLPLGSGFGSFDPMFRIVEPDALLAPTYFNHAHNDLIELAITGGIPALLLLAGFVFWWGVSSFSLLRAKSADVESRRFGLLGAVVILVLLLASVADYPLRTPLLAAVLAIACGWLGAARGDGRGAAA